MKRCPECGREYDHTMMFCLDDGTELLYGPAAESEAATAILHETAPPAEAASRAQIHTTEPRTALLSSSSQALEPATVVFSDSKSHKDLEMNTIAVLPFLNMSPKDDAEYFADGLAEEILNVLSKITGLKVAARTSSFSFKGNQATISDVGRLLNVASVLEGSVRMSSDRVRISVKLIKVEDGYHLWSETYDRTLDDIFAVQDDIAASVVKELRTTLLNAAPDLGKSGILSAEVFEAVKRRPQHPQTQLLYFHGRHLIERFNTVDNAKGIGYLIRASEAEPGCALIWAELSRAYALDSQVGGASEFEAYGRARQAAERALSLVPDFVEGHIRIGWIRMLYDLDWKGAEAAFLRALELEPENGLVLTGLATLAYKSSRLSEAIALYRRALTKDPLNAPVYHNLGFALEAADLHTEAEEAFRKALEIAPQRFVTRASLSITLSALGRYVEALEQAMGEPFEVYQLYAMAMINYARGNKVDADAALNELTEKYAGEWAFQIAEVYGSRKEIDTAFEWLARAIAQKDGGRTQARVSPHLRSLREDPRWTPFLSGLGF